MVQVSRQDLLRSLDAQRAEFADSIVLTPTDSLPFSLADRHRTAFLHGLYLTDKSRGREAKMDTLVQFGGRDAASADIGRIYGLVADALGAAAGSLRLLSGLHAQTATMMAVTRIGQKVALLSEEAGGHYSTHAILERLGLDLLDLPVDRDHMRIDRTATMLMVEREQPDVLLVDRSEGLTYEDFSFLGELQCPIKVFDASQYLVPIASGRYANPLRWGFDLMIFSLHKSFPGPQKAGIVAREEGQLWDRLTAGLSSLVSSSHAESIYLAGLALLRHDWMSDYEQRLFDTAFLLDGALADLGIDVVDRRFSRSDEPSTHHLWIRCANRTEAFEYFEHLTGVGVHVNYRKLPYGLGYGLRLGTSHSSVAGVEARHIDELAGIVHDALTSGHSASLRNRTAELARDARQGAILPSEFWHSDKG